MKIITTGARPVFGRHKLIVLTTTVFSAKHGVLRRYSHSRLKDKNAPYSMPHRHTVLYTVRIVVT